jgi:hypothetical protein
MSPVKPPESITVDTMQLYCDGGGKTIGAELGHPRVFLTMTAAGAVDCPYCGRHYVMAAGVPKAGTH